MDAAIAGDGLRGRLREDTQALHEQLDGRFYGTVAADLEHYSRFLLMHGRVLPVLEAVLAADPEYRTLESWVQRFRADALEQDLTGLGLEMPEPGAFAHDPQRGSAAGIAYVLEGSRVGGRAIAAQLAKSGLGAVPTAFLHHGREQRHWPNFLDWLETRAGDASYRDGAVAGASAAFRFYLEASEV